MASNKWSKTRHGRAMQSGNQEWYHSQIRDRKAKAALAILRLEDHDDPDPVALLITRDMRDLVQEVLANRLALLEREIIKLRYGIVDGYHYSIEEVGRRLKVTRERVRHVEDKALRKMRHSISTRTLMGLKGWDEKSKHGQN